MSIHPPTQEATAVKPWKNAQRVSSEALAKGDMLRRVPPKTQKEPRLSSRGAPQWDRRLAARLLAGQAAGWSWRNIKKWKSYRQDNTEEGIAKS